MDREKQFIYFLLCCSCVTINFNTAAIAAIIPSISRDLGISDIVAAQVVPYYLIPYGVGALIYAPLTRYVSYKRILSVGLLLYVLFSFVCSRAESISMLSAGLLGMGLTGASVIPLGLMIIGQLFEKQVRGRLVGGFFSCSFLASVIGVSMSGLAPWRWQFLIPAVMGSLTVAGMMLFKEGLLRHVHGTKVDYIKSLCNPQIRNIFILIFVLSFLYHGVHKWFGVYLSRDYGLEKLAISLFFIILAVSGGLGQLLGGYLSDRKGRRVACLTGVAVLSVATMLLVGHYPLAILAVIFSLLSAGWTIGHNGISTVLTDFPDEHRAEIASLNSALRFLSGGLGFQVSSFFVQKSFGWTFLGIGACMLLALGALPHVIPTDRRENPLHEKG